LTKLWIVSNANLWSAGSHVHLVQSF
jgi:hypothetical protein